MSKATSILASILAHSRSSVPFTNNLSFSFILSMADGASPGEKRSLEDCGERSEEKKKNNDGEDGVETVVETTTSEGGPNCSGPSSTPPLSPNSTTEVKSSGRSGIFANLFRRAFSTAPPKNKEFWESLTLEEKRKHYKCGKDYLTLSNIPKWTEFFQAQKVTPIKEPPKYPFNEALNDKVSIFQGDITKLEIDGIVNAANSSLMGGGGVDGAIHSAASYSLRDECALLNGCATGQTKITTGHRLPAKYILHTVGPFNSSGKLLESCYTTCYKLVKGHNLRSVAFCCVATGVYGFPNEDAAHIALDTTRKWLEDQDNYKNIDRIIFVVFLKLDLKIYTQLMQTYFPLSNTSTDTPLPPEGTSTSSDETSPSSDTAPSDSTPLDTTGPSTPPNDPDTSAETPSKNDKPNLVKSVTAPPIVSTGSNNSELNHDEEKDTTCDSIEETSPPIGSTGSNNSELNNDEEKSTTCDLMEVGDGEEEINKESSEDTAMETESQPVETM